MGMLSVPHILECISYRICKDKFHIDSIVKKRKSHRSLLSILKTRKRELADQSPSHYSFRTASLHCLQQLNLHLFRID
jgi:hypothetical protein